MRCSLCLVVEVVGGDVDLEDGGTGDGGGCGQAFPSVKILVSIETKRIPSQMNGPFVMIMKTSPPTLSGILTDPQLEPSNSVKTVPAPEMNPA